MDPLLDPVAGMIEALLWDYEREWKPPGLELMEQADLLMWASATSSPYSSRVVRAVFTDRSADDEISRVVEFFEKRGKPFTWWIGPSTRPLDLGARLAAYGFELKGRDDGLARAVERLDIPLTSGVTLEPVESEEQVREMVSIASAGFGHSADVAEAMVRERLSYLALPERRGGFLLARVSGMAAGYAGWRDSGDGRCVYLSGAATLEEYRGRGIYSALLAARLSGAAERGRAWAAVQANPETSSPILRRHGFEQRCAVEVYEYRPAR